MKQRHFVTLGVFLVLVVAIGGILLRLATPDSEESVLAGLLGEMDLDEEAEDAVREVQRVASGGPLENQQWIPVEAAPVRRDTFVIWVTASGRAAPLRFADIRAEVQGAVTEVAVREGQYVRAGQFVGRIDPQIYEIRVRRAQATLDRVQAEYMDRILFDDQLPDSLGEARARQARIRVGLDEQEASLAEAQYELAKTEITAPYAGRVANLAIAPGIRLNAGDSVVSVVDVSQVDIDAEVLHSEIPLIEVGREATATFPALPGEVFNGRVVSINPIIDRETQTARVTVRLLNPEARILGGMPGEVRIAGRRLADRTFVPKAAIAERSRRQVVFVFEAAEPGSEFGLAKWEYVTTGLENDSEMEIVEGAGTPATYLPPTGALVLVSGHASIAHDARIQVTNYADLGIDTESMEEEAAEGSTGVSGGDPGAGANGAPK